MTWEAEFVGGALDGAVRTFPGVHPPATLNVEMYPLVDWAAVVVPDPVRVRYRAELCMDPDRPQWLLVLEGTG